MALCISGCRFFEGTNKPEREIVFGAPAMYGQTMVLNSRQLDSLCGADGLSRNLNDWIVTTYIDYETRDTVYRYTFIKKISKKEELTYILTPRDTLYKVIKRTVK